jgi:hypothetical protein
MNNQADGKQPDRPTKREPSATRADAVATSWQNPEVRERHQAGMRERYRLIRDGKARCFICGRGPENDDAA